MRIHLHSPAAAVSCHCHCHCHSYGSFYSSSTAASSLLLLIRLSRSFITVSGFLTAAWFFLISFQIAALADSAQIEAERIWSIHMPRIAQFVALSPLHGICMGQHFVLLAHIVLALFVIPAVSTFFCLLYFFC